MSVRPFDWRDIPTLHRNRHRSIYLHSQLLYTRGALVLPGTLLSYLAPSVGILTAISNAEGTKLIGQTLHPSGFQSAYLTYITPEEGLSDRGLPVLIDYLARLAGRRGAFRLQADVNEQDTMFEVLRQEGFVVYTRQRIWQLKNLPDGGGRPSYWRAVEDIDGIPIRSLYHNLVPPLVQQVEPLSNHGHDGLVYRLNGDLLAYVDLKYGHRGIWAQPFVHPDAGDVTEILSDLFTNLPYRRSRPVYFCVRSYQGWLEGGLKDLGAEIGPSQAVMVKHLVAHKKAERMFALPALEGGQPEISAPIARSEHQ